MIDAIDLNLDLNRRSPPPSKNKIILIFLAVLAGLLFTIIAVKFQQLKKTEQTQIPKLEEIQPSPTQKPEIDKKKVRIQVLNGSGVSGQAGAVVEALKKEGYTAENIKAGNAGEFNATNTTISVRAGFEEIAKEIKNTLQTIFNQVKIDSSTPENNEYDIVIVTGGKTLENSVFHPTPTISATTPPLTPTNQVVSPNVSTTINPTLIISPTP